MSSFAGSTRALTLHLWSHNHGCVLSRGGADAFGFVNEEQLADGSWSDIDEWRYLRKS